MSDQLTEEEFKKLPLVSSVTTPNKDCPGSDETEEVRLLDDEEIQAVFIHDYPMCFQIFLFCPFMCTFI